MAHGAGGKATQTLIEGLLVPAFGPRDDPASPRSPTPAGSTVDGAGLAMTTDSFVVKPLRFPGGSIGELAVNGTVNDLAVAGARPLAITVALILEEGLRRRRAARRGRGDRRGRRRGRGRGDRRRHQGRRARVLPTGCTSRPRDRGRRPARDALALVAAPGDRILVSGPIGEHGRRSCSPATSSRSTPTSSPTPSRCGGGRRAARRRGRGAALHARRDPRRRRDRAQRARPRLRGRRSSPARRDVRSGPTWPAPPRSSGSTRCTSPTRADWSRSSRPTPPRPRSRPCARCPGARGQPRSARSRPSRPGMVLVDTAFGGKRVMDLLAGDPLPRIC